MNNKEVAKKVVDRIVELVESGSPLPWVKPWNRKPNTVTVKDGVKTVTVYPSAWNRRGVEYKGANTYLPSGEYITFAQCKAEGGTVKKGAHGWPVVYWNFVKKTVKVTDPATGEESEKVTVLPFLKYYTVFRVSDCDGIKQKHFKKPRTVEIPITHEEVVVKDGSLNADAEAVISDYIDRAGNGFKVLRDTVSDEAFYAPYLDYVKVPMREQFGTESEFYSTLFHELGHSTGHASRLNRFAENGKSAAFGSEDYSREELVAESTAAAILNALGMEEGNTFRNSAAYIKSWASHIKEDPLMYITATTRAQDAVNLILGITEDTEATEEAATE